MRSTFSTRRCRYTSPRRTWWSTQTYRSGLLHGSGASASSPSPPSLTVVVTVDRIQLLITSLHSWRFVRGSSEPYEAHQDTFLISSFSTCPYLEPHSRVSRYTLSPTWLLVDAGRALPTPPEAQPRVIRPPLGTLPRLLQTPCLLFELKLKTSPFCSPPRPASPAPAPQLQGRHVAVSVSVLVLVLVVNSSPSPFRLAQRQLPTSHNPSPQWLPQTSTSSPLTRITAAWLSVSAGPIACCVHLQSCGLMPQLPYTYS